MTQYLSKDYLNRMRKKVHNFVEENYWKGDAEKARIDLRDTCRMLFFEMSSKIIPDSDKAILVKYGYIDEVKEVWFNFIEVGEQIRVRLSDSSPLRLWDKTGTVSLQFWPGTALHTLAELRWNGVSNTEYFENKINRKKSDNAVCLFDALKDLHMLETTGKCEIEDLVNAIMAKTDSFKTVNQLIKVYPDMEKFLPDPSKKEVSMKRSLGADEDSQKRLESFLNDIVEPEFQLP